jgi:peptide chain release factor 1
MLRKIEEAEHRLNDLELELSNPEIIKDKDLYQKYAKEHSNLKPIVDIFRKFKEVKNKIEDAKSLLNDSDTEIRELAHSEINILKSELHALETKMGILLSPKDPRDGKNVILEIRAGTGGEEAALFVADLFRMYAYYAEQKKWKVDIISQNHTGLGGFKEIIASITGDRVYSGLKYESGVHRVQRVPETEAQGRIHTSAVTVAVLPEAEEVEISIDPSELRIDVYRSSGPGGQSVNTTDSAVRITHIPTGLVVSCQDEKSQHKNKAKGMKVLRSRLLDMKAEEQQSEISKERKNMVGSGDRSERIRTYNFPQGRVTDHRMGLTLYRLDDILQGRLDLLLDPISAYFNAENKKEEAAKLS